MFRPALAQWLRSPLVTGWPAVLCVIVAVTAPTLVRLAVDGAITGCEFTPYLPFVLISAVLLRWWQAAAVSLLSIAIMGGVFQGVHHFETPCFASAAGMFAASSAAMIGLAVLVRQIVVALQKRGADETLGGIVFSLEKGQVWASWYGQGAPILLGSQRKVSEMMQDFLAQEELARRLSAK
jgi:hypothetical protein